MFFTEYARFITHVVQGQTRPNEWFRCPEAFRGVHIHIHLSFPLTGLSQNFLKKLNRPPIYVKGVSLIRS